jgi:hypothetical protein
VCAVPLACRKPRTATSGDSGTARAVGSAPSASASSRVQCGKLTCRIFASAEEAFRVVLAENPAVLGVGEAHALRGTSRIEPAVRRFTRELLPLLKGRASDLVVEVMVPNPSCSKETEGARQEQRVVTSAQSENDQNDYVALARAARAEGIGAYPLKPTCADLARIQNAGADAVLVSLEVVTRLVTETLSGLVEKNRAAADPRMIVAYGGAMHNDVAPDAEHARFGFGPAMRALTLGRYTELDAIIPEFIGNTGAWHGQAWTTGFDSAAHADEVRLLDPAPHSFVLVFATTRSAPDAGTAPSLK